MKLQTGPALPLNFRYLAALGGIGFASVGATIGNYDSFVSLNLEVPTASIN